MRILYGTGNPAKLEVMIETLAPLNIEIFGLKDLRPEDLEAGSGTVGADGRIILPDIVEDGRSPLENAQKKALAYYKALGIPVFSCDSGLYLEGVPEEVQPGVHVRTINGCYLGDEEMREYYIGLVKQYGFLDETTGRRYLQARYRNGICLVMDEEHIYSAMEESMAGEAFYFTEIPHTKRKQGFPLDCISIEIKSGKYYYDLEESEFAQLDMEGGFLKFFENILAEYGR